MKKVILLSTISIMFLISLNIVSATVLLSGVKETYNLGDTIALEARFSRAEAFNGFSRISLFCDNIESLMYFSPMGLAKNQEKRIIVDFPVAKTGSCYIAAVLEDNRNTKVDETKSSAVTLSSNIDINLEISGNTGQEFMPKDTLKLSGSAVKANGQNVNGIAYISLDNKSYSPQVSDGKFSFSLTLEKNIAPGEHAININVNDDSNNSGNKSAKFSVATVPTTLAIETNNNTNSFMPGSTMMITPKMMDQANNTLQSSIAVTLSKGQGIFSKSQIVLEELIQSGNNTLYYFGQFAEPQDYVIEAKTTIGEKEFTARRAISVSRYEKINVSILNDTLKVTNIGNVPFKKQVELEFLIQGQSTKKLVDLNLDINETKTFKLEAPQGIYSLTLNTGSEQLSFKQVPLTGSVVATIDLGKEVETRTTWIFIILAIVAVLIIISVYLKMRRHKYNQYKKTSHRPISSTSDSTYSHPQTKSLAQPSQQETKPQQHTSQQTQHIAKLEAGERQTVDTFATMYTDETIKKIFKQHASSKLPAQAIIPTLVYGTKQEITTMILTIQGLDKLQELKKKDNALYEKILNEYFGAVVDKIKTHNGVADLYGNNIIALFNVVKQYRHDIAAVKAAQEIRQLTNELNSHLSQSGISLAIKAGINSGLAIVTSIGADKQVKYTSIGNTTILARALERKALANEILMPDSFYDKISNVIKAKKISPLHTAEQTAMNVYSLEDANASELKARHKWYVDRALGRK